MLNAFLKPHVYAVAIAGIFYAGAAWRGRWLVYLYFALWVLLLPVMLVVCYAGAFVWLWCEIDDRWRNGWKPPEPMPILSGKSI